MSDQKSNFIQHGYHVLQQTLSPDELQNLEQEYHRLYKHGQNILQTVQQTQTSLDAFYQQHAQELIVVPEADNPEEICRFEYLTGFSKTIHTFVQERIKVLLDNFLNTPFTLFKDKCNLKHPKGGAFSPHQDIAAYYHFGPSYFATAAIFLDDATLENGCLEMAGQYRQELQKPSEITECDFGSFPFLEFYQGGKNNGDIQTQISRHFTWTPIKAKRGDVVLFDAHVPHQSQANLSTQKRRVFFFTFNAASDGDLYNTYYDTKRNRYNDPMFHVSTPTHHNAE